MRLRPCAVQPSEKRASVAGRQPPVVMIDPIEDLLALRAFRPPDLECPLQRFFPSFWSGPIAEARRDLRKDLQRIVSSDQLRLQEFGDDLGGQQNVVIQHGELARYGFRRKRRLSGLPPLAGRLANEDRQFAFDAHGRLNAIACAKDLLSAEVRERGYGG